MKMPSNKIVPLILFSIVVVMSSCPLLAQTARPIVYVWEFANRDGTVNGITTSLTEEFEEVLIQTNCCTVLQRRKYADLFEQRGNERAIMNLDNVSDAAINDLKTNEADMVVFGEVYDDLQSGTVNIIVNYETFRSTIVDKKSINIPRYVYTNPFTRKEEVEKLVDGLDFSEAFSVAKVPIEKLEEITPLINTGIQEDSVLMVGEIGKDITDWGQTDGLLSVKENESKKAQRRSLLFPGRGQLYKEETKKGVFFVVGAGLGISTTLTAGILSRKYKIDTDQARAAYEEAIFSAQVPLEQGGEVRNDEFLVLQNTFNKGKRAQKVALLAAAATILIWTTSVIDSGKGFHQSNPQTQGAKKTTKQVKPLPYVEFRDGKPSYGVLLTFHL